MPVGGHGGGGAAAPVAHLHVHSCFSLLRGGNGLHALLTRARDLGLPALALTDTNAMYGLVPFTVLCRDMGLRPVLGVELHCGRTRRVVALARNLTGYSNLCRLTTARRLEPDFDLAAACIRYRDDVYFLTQEPALLTALAPHVPRRRLFAELVPRPGVASWRRLQQLRTTAQHLDIGCVVTNDVFFVSPADYATHRTVRAIDHTVAQEQLDADEHDVAPPDAWLKSPAELAAALPGLEDAFANTIKIAEDCQVELPMGAPQFPQAPLPAGRTPREHLRAECRKGLRRRYGPRPQPVVRARLDYELDVIDRLGFSPYFLIVQDIVRYAQQQGIPCVGRGSAADSLVAYALGISAVDPIHYDLYFERFLHPGRTDCPDIDIDFCWRGRDDVLEYVYETYGRDHVAMICSFITFGARSAFRDVAKTFGLPLAQVDRISARLPHAAATDIRAALEHIPECRSLPFDREPFCTILSLAEKIDGFPRHLGIHPCGVVIAPMPLTDLVPLERATKGLVVTQYDMHPIEALGLVKMDLLGQRALSIVTDAAKTVNTFYRPHPPLKLDELPEPDPTVAEMARTGDTMGCFQIDSPGMRNLLQQIRAETRMDLIKALSLIRPGPAASGMKEAYVRRARGLEPVPTSHPMLDELLADTYGVLLYQEDLLRIAHKLAGFSRAEADALRKAMSKHRSPERMAAVRQQFLDGCAANGVAPAVAQEVWTRMQNFAGYSYCKAHACTYGHISYQGLWLKAHYPTAFYAAVLNNAAGMYSARTYLAVARRHGVRVRPPDVNLSDAGCTVEEATPEEVGARSEAVYEPPAALRIGLQHVRGMAADTVEAIVRERPFRDLRDLCARVPVARDEIDALIRCGACDGFGMTRPQLLWEMLQAFPCIQAGKHAEQPLFPHERFLDHLPPVPALPDYDAAQRLRMEREVLGLELSMHPLGPYADALAEHDLVPANELAAHAGKVVRVAGWLVATRRVIAKPRNGDPTLTVDAELGFPTSSKTGAAQPQYMRFVTLEDATGLIEVVLFPDAYQQYGHRIRSHGPYVVTGVVDDSYGACTVTATDVVVLDEPMGMNDDY